MIHIKIAWFLIGVACGITAMLVTIAFMMGACPDSPKKRQRDWEGLQEHVVRMKERSYCKGYKKGFAQAVQQYEPAIKLYEAKYKEEASC